MNNENSGKRKAIAVGCGAFAVRGLVSGFLPLLYVMFPIRMIAIAIFLHFCMSGVGDLLSGFCVSKIGYRFSAFAGLILTAIGMLALGFHPGMSGSVGLIVSSVLTGLGCGVAGAASGNIVRWYSDDTDKKIRLMYILYAAAQLASLAVSLIFLLAAGIWAWNIVAAMWGIFPVGCAMYLVLLPFEEPEYDRNGETWRELFGNASFVILFCLMFFAGAAERSMGQWIAAYTEGSSETFGVILALCAPALFTICIGVSRILYSKFSDRIKLQRFMVYGCALGTAAYLLAILAGNNVLSLVGCILVGAFTGILIPGTFSLASAKVPAAGASIFTLLLLAGDLGYGVGPALVGIAAGIFDFNLKKGMFIALIFPIAMIVTIMKVNKNLAGKLIREKKTWIALACATLVVTLSAFTGGCEQSTAVTTPKPTPTQVIMETPVPLNTPTFTPSPALEPTEAPTPTPTRKPTITPTPTVTPSPVPTGFPGINITARTGKVAATDSINIRIGPGTGYKVVGGGKPGEVFTLIGETSNGWWQISYKSNEGDVAYISQTYSRLTEGNIPVNTPTSEIRYTPTPTPATVVVQPTATPTPRTSATMSFEDYVGFNGNAYIAIDAKTGAILHKYNENVKQSPASLTKMLTALIAVEQYYLNDECYSDIKTLRWNDVEYNEKTVKGIDNEMVTFTSLVESNTGKKFTAEDWIDTPYTVEERLYQMLLYSAADAAEALAFKIDDEMGDDYFVDEVMSYKATELGLTGSTFTNPAGADGSCGTQFAGNVSTARDLAIIAKALMEDGTLRKIVASSTYTIPENGIVPATVLRNTNLLIADSAYKSTYFDCIGIKTGHTDEAGYCLAACGTNSSGREVIVITLGNRTRQSNAEQTMKMLEYIFRYE